MRSYILSFFLINFLLTAFNTNCFSQTEKSILKGKVVNKETSEPIQYATVFLAYTSRGTLTDEKGEFIIVGIADGNYEVVCAAVGFERVTTTILFLNSKKSEVYFSLKPVPIQVGEVNVTASVPEDWEDNLLKFTKEFLGESTIARQCIISNPEVIDFEIKENKLFASSKKPLYVVNKSLGYKVTVYIKHFEWDVDYDEGKFAYEPFFENMTSVDSTQVIRWNENRKAAYKGSFIHFLRNCATGKGFDEGFRLLINETENNWKSKVETNKQMSRITQNNWQTKEEFESMLMKRMKKIPPNIFLIETFDQIVVVYKNNSEDHNYKWYKNRVFGIGDIKDYQSSVLNLPNGRLTFNTEGNILDRTMFNTAFSGYWAWKRLGDLVPNDYEPPKDDE